MAPMAFTLKVQLTGATAHPFPLVTAAMFESAFGTDFGMFQLSGI